MKGRKHISRCDGARVHGWQVRYERQNFVRYRLFSDSRYGGKRRAFLAACQYRDQLERKALKSLGKGRAPGLGTIKYCDTSYTDFYGKRQTYRSIQAWIRIAPGKHAKTQWSIDKWGRTAAREGIERWLESKRRLQRINYARGRDQARAS